MRLSPALVLFFMSPLIGELLSGSAPPLQFFNPSSFLILTILYGGSAVIIREIVFRWKKGWLSILILGLAFGILNEGVIAKSFFDPAWKDLGPLSEYGRALGVNWVWVTDLLIYHAIISISIPIALTNLLFPQKLNEPWLGNKTLFLLILALVLNSLFGYSFINQYQPSPLAFTIFVFLMFSLIILAKLLPQGSLVQSTQSTSFTKRFYFLGFLFNVVLFFISDGLAANHILPLLNVVIVLGINIFLVFLFLKFSQSLPSTKQQFNFIAGALSFYILLSFIHEASGRTGMSIVGILFTVFLILLYRSRFTQPQK